MHRPADIRSFAEALQKLRRVRIFRDGCTLSRHHAFRLLRTERVEKFWGDELSAITERKLFDAGRVESTDDPDAVVERGGTEEDNIRIGISDRQSDRDGIRERRCPHAV